MDNLDDSENTAKVSDSAYSNSCSNSQSRRSHSSKSTISGSHSSRSSGYEGKPSTFSDNNGKQSDKTNKEKDGKQKKTVSLEKTAEIVKEVDEQPMETAPTVETIQQEPTDNVDSTPAPQQTKAEKVSDALENSAPENPGCSKEDGFSFVISKHDGVVMYTTSSLTATLGFPKDMWIGRCFIDFVHSRDRNTFVSHITTGLTIPKNVNGTIIEVPTSQNSVCTMVCRLRRYRSMSNGYGVKERSVAYMPFLLKLSFKTISGDEGNVSYLVVQATPFYSAFKVPNELLVKTMPFVLRHAANGNVEYIDLESVPYLGYVPQDLEGKNALQLYHVDDLPYIRQVYETIVKEGGVPRSKPYRMMTQNWDFIKVETEWSSFINPWSKKLEFVIGKHRVIEGPTNPDVFQSPKADKTQKVNEEEAKKSQSLRDSIIKIMNEVLTKPAEEAKQQMAKRCQDLASFMESLIEEHPKAVDELHVDTQDPDSFYEPDSVMLGGVSPHHDYNDSKSSVETTLSYNQVNYNETLQRYFDSHQPYSYEDFIVAGENILGLNASKPVNGIKSTVVYTSGISGEISSCGSGSGSVGGNSLAVTADESSIRLTENLINKHNAEMEKELMKIHRETRSSTKRERKKVVNENKQKKEEHLARCNAAFQPTPLLNPLDMQPHGVKRTSKQLHPETIDYKHHCPTPRQGRKKQQSTGATAAPSTTVTTTALASAAAAGQWADNSANAMNALFLGVGFPQPISMMGAMPGMIPMYYTPTAAVDGNSAVNNALPNNGMANNGITNTNTALNQQPMQCMMYGQAVYGSPFMYSTISPQIAYPQLIPTSGNDSLGLTTSNYFEACKQSEMDTKTKTLANRDKSQNKDQLFPPSGDSSVGTSATGLWREKQLKSQNNHSKINQGSSTSNFSSSVTCNRDGENSDSLGTAKMDLCSSGTRFTPSTDMTPRKSSGEETTDRTDGESSYSAFYSSFLKTDSGSAEDSPSELKKIDRGPGTGNTYYEPRTVKTARRKAEPPWLEQVDVSQELMYKYQVPIPNKEDVLRADRLKMEEMEQPALVNEQLEQLYFDMQLEGVGTKLTLDEETASSCSSEDETTVSGKIRRLHDYNKMVMFYEEDLPLPPTPCYSPPPAIVVELASASTI